jgi:hypothetical protein
MIRAKSLYGNGEYNVNNVSMNGSPMTRIMCNNNDDHGKCKYLHIDVIDNYEYVCMEQKENGTFVEICKVDYAHKYNKAKLECKFGYKCYKAHLTQPFMLDGYIVPHLNCYMKKDVVLSLYMTFYDAHDTTRNTTRDTVKKTSTKIPASMMSRKNDITYKDVLINKHKKIISKEEDTIEIVYSQINSNDAKKSQINSDDTKKSHINSNDANKSQINSNDAEESHINSNDTKKSHINSDDANKSDINSSDAEKSHINSDDAEKSQINSDDAEKSQINSDINSDDANPVEKEAVLDEPAKPINIADVDTSSKDRTINMQKILIDTYLNKIKDTEKCIEIIRGNNEALEYNLQMTSSSSTYYAELALKRLSMVETVKSTMQKIVNDNSHNSNPAVTKITNDIKYLIEYVIDPYLNVHTNN